MIIIIEGKSVQFQEIQNIYISLIASNLVGFFLCKHSISQWLSNIVHITQLFDCCLEEDVTLS